MHGSRRSQLLSIIPFLVVALVIAAQFFDTGRVLSTARNLVFDIYQRIAPRPYIDPMTVAGTGVRFVDIDEDSIERFGQWPWPRTLVAGLIDRAHAMGAKAMVFDIVFSEPDRTSPEAMGDSWPHGPAYDEARAFLSGLPHHDDVFARIIPKMPVVTAFILAHEKRVAQPIRKSGISHVGQLDPLDYVPRYQGAIVNLDAIEDASAGNGAINVEPDADGIIRRVNLLFNHDDKLLPSLALEAMRLASKPQSVIVKTAGGGGETSFGAASGIIALRVGKTTIDTAKDGSIWLHFTPPVPERRISAQSLLDGSVDPARVKDAVLFVGTSAAGLRDLRATPMSGAFPGVEIQAQALEQMLLGYSLSRPDYWPAVEIAYALILGIAVVVLVLAFSAFWALPVMLIGVAVAVGTSWWGFSGPHWLIDPVAPSLTVIAGFAAASFVSFLRTEAERQFVRGAMGHYLPHQVVEKIAADPSILKLGGETRELTIMFCDIRGFTAIAEDYRDQPEELTKLINRILTPLTRVVLDYRGTIDKYIGDCIMAFWNAPLDDPDHAANACQCALEMQTALTKLNAELEAEHIKTGRPFRPIEVGIGINSGPCVVGNMGSDLRFDYSVLGDAVNLAARIQTYSGNYGAAIAVAEPTRAIVHKTYALLQVDYLAVKGRDEPVKVYVLTGNSIVGASPLFKALDAFHQNIFEAVRAQDWTKARALIDECRKVKGASEKLYDLYLQRIDVLEKSPPAPDWDGAWRATEK